MPLKHNTRHISWDSSGIFYPLNVCCCELACQKQKKKTKQINTEREGAQRFVGICVDHGVSQLNVTTIVDNTCA